MAKIKNPNKSFKLKIPRESSNNEDAGRHGVADKSSGRKESSDLSSSPKESNIKYAYGAKFYELPKITKSDTERFFAGDVKGIIENNTPFISVSYQGVIISSQLIGNFQFSNIMLAICVGDYFNKPKNSFNVIACPKNITQAKVAAEVIQSYSKSDLDDSNTAIVLADEALLYPVLHNRFYTGVLQCCHLANQICRNGGRIYRTQLHCGLYGTCQRHYCCLCRA